MTLELGDLRLAARGVVLRPLETDDAEALALAAAESREAYAFTQVPSGLAEARRYVERAIRQRSLGERFPFAIEWNGRIVGSTSYVDFQPWSWPEGCALRREGRPDAVEIGHTWLAASAQRTSCNTVAKSLLLGQSFDGWQVHRVTFRTDERNHRSRRAIERLGAQFEGIRRAHTRGIDCTVRNSAYYSIIADEWPAVRSNLLEKLERAGG